MSRRRRTQIEAQFAPRLIEMLESPAYRALSLAAHRILSRVETELAHHGGTENGRLPITYDDFQRYGVERHGIKPAIDEAVALGFLEITQAGRAGNAEFRAPNFFRLTYRHTDKDEPTHEWRGIETKAKAKAKAKAARHAHKMQKPVREKTQTSAQIHHRNHSGESRTTAPSGESRTTFDISGRERSEASEARPPRRRSERAERRQAQ